MSDGLDYFLDVLVIWAGLLCILITPDMNLLRLLVVQTCLSPDTYAYAMLQSLLRR